ncbi:MAG: peptidase [Alphaproteobacteria bacterium]|nr:peptidase [Alphaproteobacteria bacterium]
MIWVLLTLLVCALLFGPTLWVRSVMSRHSADRPDFPGTGGELARHLLDSAELTDVIVEPSPAGDHYDPTDKAVRLTKANYEGRSLTAVAVAAHEVGHALQDRDEYKPLKARHRIVKAAAITDTVGSVILFGLSFAGTAAAGPRLLILGVVAVIVMGLIRVAANLITLPVELDASFKRALPILEEGAYIKPDDVPAARGILKAAAYTYVAASAMQLLNFFRLLRGIR